LGANDALEFFRPQQQAGFPLIAAAPSFIFSLNCPLFSSASFSAYLPPQAADDDDDDPFFWLALVCVR